MQGGVGIAHEGLQDIGHHCTFAGADAGDNLHTWIEAVAQSVVLEVVAGGLDPHLVESGTLVGDGDDNGPSGGVDYDSIGGIDDGASSCLEDSASGGVDDHAIGVDGHL